jgi:hypothetical protein
MLDGRIDVQGTTEELRTQGILDTIKQDSSLDQQLKAHKTSPEEPSDAENTDKTKRPRQLVEDEARETGGVKWSTYKTYLKASSYWTWITLAISICIYQLLGVIEKLWIKQWGEVSNVPVDRCDAL